MPPHSHLLPIIQAQYPTIVRTPPLNAIRASVNSCTHSVPINTLLTQLHLQLTQPAFIFPAKTPAWKQNTYKLFTAALKQCICSYFHGYNNVLKYCCVVCVIAACPGLTSLCMRCCHLCHCSSSQFVSTSLKLFHFYINFQAIIKKILLRVTGQLL